MNMPIPTGLTFGYDDVNCAGGSFTGPTMPGKMVGWITPGATLIIHNVTYTTLGGGINDVVDETQTDCPAEFAIEYEIKDSPNLDTIVIFAWSGHVSANEDVGTGFWGSPNAIPTGSPYHMRVGDITDGNGDFTNIGNQELQLSATGIIRPSQIIVIKQTDPPFEELSPAQKLLEFNFTTTGINYDSFNLTSNGFNQQQVATNLKVTGNANDPNFGLLSGTELFSVTQSLLHPLEVLRCH